MKPIEVRESPIWTLFVGDRHLTRGVAEQAVLARATWRQAQTVVGQENFNTVSRVGDMEQAPKPIRRVRFGEFEVDFLERRLYR